MSALSQADIDELTLLEESLWRSETRFDPAHMERVLATEFLEFGRSGRVYSRLDTLAVQPQRLQAALANLAVQLVATDVVLVTYLSEVRYDEIEYANRSSLWVRPAGHWQLRFHQGTPVARRVGNAVATDLPSSSA